MGEGGQSCAGAIGAIPGATSLTGDEYLAALSSSHSHIWRNFGIICAWWVLFVALTIFFTSRWKLLDEGGRNLLFPRELQHKSKHLLQTKDEEAQPTEKSVRTGPDTSGSSLGNDLHRNKSIFTWKNLTYTVKTPEGDRILLNNVQGYVKPGMLGALMGSSGAGKTTLLDVLAQRKTAGTIHGSVLVDGRPLPISFNARLVMSNSWIFTSPMRLSARPSNFRRCYVNLATRPPKESCDTWTISLIFLNLTNWNIPSLVDPALVSRWSIVSVSPSVLSLWQSRAS
jgi:hypothetical protein